MVIHLISGPRNISTALMYAFAQKPDTRVLDEPFYAFYLQHTGLQHPGREEILASQPKDPEKVFDWIRQTEKENGHVFVKNMGHHLQGFDFSRIRDYRNVFLIRDPKQMLVSYARVRELPTLNDIGLQHQAELFNWLQSLGQAPLVLDGNAVRANPEGILRQLCAKLDLSFDPGMLTWPAGPRPEDGVWAPHWYAQVHQSTHFSPPDPDPQELSPALSNLYEEALPFYQTLKAHALTA